MSEIISDKGIDWLHNKIEKLEAENKDLKEKESHTFVENECLIKENRALKNEVTELLEAKIDLKQNRDELLGALKFYADVKSYKGWYVRNDNKGDLARHVIQKAEALKEKETE